MVSEAQTIEAGKDVSDMTKTITMNLGQQSIQPSQSSLLNDRRKMFEIKHDADVDDSYSRAKF